MISNGYPFGSVDDDSCSHRESGANILGIPEHSDTPVTERGQ
jgi:hypothetical protein